MPRSSAGRPRRYQYPRGWWSEIPKGFSIKRLLARGEQLSRQAGQWYQQHFGPEPMEVTEADVSLLVGVCRQVLKRAKPDALYQSLIHLVGQPLGPNRLAAEMGRLVAVEHLLREGVATGPWRQQVYPEWVCCVLGEVEDTADGQVLPLRVIAGTPYGRTGYIPLSRGLLHFLTKRLGFKARDAKLRFYDREHLAGLYCWARAEPDPRTLYLRDITVTQTLVRYNRSRIQEVVAQYLQQRKQLHDRRADTTYWWG